jgi:nitronate monooxygenase
LRSKKPLVQNNDFALTGNVWNIVVRCRIKNLKSSLRFQQFGGRVADILDCPTPIHNAIIGNFFSFLADVVNNQPGAFGTVSDAEETELSVSMLQPESFANSLTASLGIRVPVIQAPIGSFSCPVLAAAVSEAGGLGTLALSWDSLSRCREKISETRAATRAPFGINLVLEWDQTDRLNACLDSGVKIVSFFWGDPSRYISLAHRADAKTVVMVGSSEEARKAVDAGADVIVCQGFEAGGHVRGLTGSIALIPAVVDAVAPVPVIAAGGFADGRGLVAALALGASGVWMGTRFAASIESLAHPEFKRCLIGSGESDTQHLRLFDGGWLNASHRVLRNSTVDAWDKAGRPDTGMRPNESEIIGRSQQGAEIRRYDDMPPIAGMSGDWEACALYAGESTGMVREIKPAGTIVNEIVRDAREIICSLARMGLENTPVALPARLRRAHREHSGVSVGPAAWSPGCRRKDSRHPPHALADLFDIECCQSEQQPRPDGPHRVTRKPGNIQPRGLKPPAQPFVVHVLRQHAG